MDLRCPSCRGEIAVDERYAGQTVTCPLCNGPFTAPAGQGPEAVLRVHQAYWRANPQEKASLLGRYPRDLSWPEILRLHHLTCLELLGTKAGRKAFEGDDEDDRPPSGDAAELATQLARRLLGADSPYRPRSCGLWTGRIAPDAQRPPDRTGVLRNASITHIGCIEAMRIFGEDPNLPTELVFVPFDDMQGMVFATPAAFRLAKIFYEDRARPPEIVLAPLLYGTSWASRQPYDRDGSMTRFVCHLEVPEALPANGIGVGQQDFALCGGDDQAGALFGMGNVCQIEIPLDMREADFDRKARRRGLDPDQVRRDVAGRS